MLFCKLQTRLLMAYTSCKLLPMTKVGSSHILGNYHNPSDEREARFVVRPLCLKLSVCEICAKSEAIKMLCKMSLICLDLPSYGEHEDDGCTWNEFEHGWSQIVMTLMATLLQ